MNTEYSLPTDNRVSDSSGFTIALAGNPNVGKSTIFNALTKLRQHTGNWAGKTVACASGYFSYRDARCLVVDLPGIYSLRTHSEEEEIAREYLCSGQSDLLLVVCDATCLERGLHLLKQIAELRDIELPSIILCVNLCDEAAKKGILLDFDLLCEHLNIPVIPCTARNKRGLEQLKKQIYSIYEKTVSIKNSTELKPLENPGHAHETTHRRKKILPASGGENSYYEDHSCEGLICHGCAGYAGCADCPFCQIRDDSGDEMTKETFFAYAGERKEASDKSDDKSVCTDLSDSTVVLNCELSNSLSAPGSRRVLSACIPDFSPKDLAAQAVSYTNPGYRKREETLDRILTGRFTGSLIMVLLLLGIFWLTITGANYPSALLWSCFYRIESWLAAALASLGAADWFINASVYGVFRVVAWIVSVMLPPMAIFFPLFTLLEDLGYLPRVAFNMDCAFKKCKACGKQCLTMCIVNTPAVHSEIPPLFKQGLLFQTVHVTLHLIPVYRKTRSVGAEDGR